MKTRSILLIISGGIAAYKMPELVRLWRKQAYQVKVLLTKAAAHFVTKDCLQALSSQEVALDLWDEAHLMDHIYLSREADIVVVAPCTADLMAKMAHGLADDLASTTLLACNKPIILCPSMNVAMWHHPATQENLKHLKARGITILEPSSGDLACGEHGEGRLVEIETIAAAVTHFYERNLPLTGKKIIVTSGPTQEAIDPIRYISNHSSGKQGYAIAKSLQRLGAEVHLVSGPCPRCEVPAGLHVTHVISAADMHKACLNLLPADVFIAVAAVSDWRPKSSHPQKIKKSKQKQDKIELLCVETTDILKEISHLKKNRPPLVIGFAAETEALLEHAQKKIAKKGCDWLFANDVSDNKIMGQDETECIWLQKNGEYERLPKMSKQAMADHIANLIKDHLCHK